MKNLATIQRVKNVRPCPNSENLDLVDVLGWQVVTKRNEFAEGSLCVYVAIDTLLPEKPEFEFLRNKNFRIKPIRLRGQESAGIVFPLSILGNVDNIPHPHVTVELENKIFESTYLYEGTDVTNILGVKKYEKPVPPELAGQMVGGLPGFLIATDEDNLRTYPDALPEMYGRPYYITRKEDGSSGTYFLNANEFGVCSRRIHLKETETNGFWKIARKYSIEEMLRKYFPTTPIAIQGEVVGPGIQGNHLGLKELEFRLFNIFDIVSRNYFDYEKVIEFCNNTGIPMVPIIGQGSAFGYTLTELLIIANKQTYDTGKPAEGIVIRPKEGFQSQVLRKTWSGKVLNENYKEE